MSQATPSLNLERRLTILETRIARYKHTTVAFTVIVLASGLLFGQDRTQQRIRNRGIESRIAIPDQTQPPLIVRDSITLVDSAGEERAILTATLGGASLVLFDAAGDARVGLNAGYTTSVTLYDGDLRARAILGTTPLVASHVESSDGSIERRPVSSLVLFNDVGGIVERLP